MKLVRVVAAVIRRGNAFLVCQRPALKRHGGLWEFPGGKVEIGETPLAAARRELAEELAVEVLSIGNPISVIRDPDSPYEIAFHEVAIEGVPKCIEHTELRWAEVGELLTMPMAPSDRAFAIELSRRQLS